MDFKVESEFSKEYSTQMDPEFKANFLGDREISSVPIPMDKEITLEKLFLGGEIPDTDFLFNSFYMQGKLELSAASKIIQKASEILSKEANVIHLKHPIIIVGDIHGQFYDLPTIFDQKHPLPEFKYLFLGDYIDRGWFSCECILYLYALKIKYPNEIFLLRGNHESKRMAEFFTFKIECLQKYNENIYKEIIASFHNLPIAAVVDEHFFCVHGGLSPKLNFVSDINSFDRKVEPDVEGLMCDLLWSDPTEIHKFNSQLEPFISNPVRRCSYNFNGNACSKFLETNNLLCIIRAHEVQDNGFKRYIAPGREFPLLFTVFSAPNYLDNYKNNGGIISIPHADQFDLKTFSEKPHPFCLPNRADIFEWSTPFVLEKINQILTHILTICTSDEPNGSSGGNAMSKERKEFIRNKILTLGKISSMCQNIQTERLSILKLKGLSSPATSGNSEVLAKAAEKCTEDIAFDDVKEIDKVNESIPEMTSDSSSKM